MDNQENEKRQYILFEAVLNHVKEQAQTKLPERGLFLKFGIGFVFPDEKYHGYLQIDRGQEPEKRVADIGVYEAGSDRVVRNFLFFESSQAVRDWLGAESSVEELKKTAQHLRQRAEGLD